MYKNKILVPVDFRPANEPAIQIAAEMADALGARLILLHVVSPARSTRPVTPYALAREEMGEQVHLQLEQYRQWMHGAHGPVRWEREVRFGKIKAAIMKAAKEHRVRFIVMATHGREGLARMVTGSVTDYLVRHAPCPVVCIPPNVAKDALPLSLTSS